MFGARTATGGFDAESPNFGAHHLQWYQPPLNLPFIFRGASNPTPPAPDLKSPTAKPTSRPATTSAVSWPRPVNGWWLTVRLYDPLRPPPVPAVPLPLTHAERLARDGKEAPFVAVAPKAPRAQLYEAVCVLCALPPAIHS